MKLPIEDVRHMDDGPLLVVGESPFEFSHDVSRQLGEHVVRCGDTDTMSDDIREGSTMSGILTKVVMVVLRDRGDSRPNAVGIDAAGSGVPKEFLDSLPVLRG